MIGSRSEIPLLAERSATAAPAGTLATETTSRADSGLGDVVRPALVAVADTVDVLPNPTFRPGDTLVVLDYLGEGSSNVWHDGRVLEITGFWGAEQADPRSELIGQYASEWWVHASGPHRVSGWFRAESPGIELGGADACGGPALI